MNSRLYSFMDIFEATFSDGQNAVRLHKIVIPMIQRDYAQGRLDPEISRVRRRFLDSLYDAVVRQPVTLDFVYGDIDENGIMTPLDGQQRLTTLYLLHWYAARKAGVSMEESAFLSNFSYETRYSARYFCRELTAFVPSFTGTLSEEIVDQAWFPLGWKRDPTVSSMLVMLDEIDKKFRDMDNLWERLKEGAVTFYFLPIKDMGLSDELYIKMNSRGKPLTRFEHFKAELERCIRAADDTTAKRIMRKTDRDWTDMLWRYRDSGNGKPEDNITDDEFLRYFHFVCDVICWQGGGSPQGKSSDEFDMLAEYFTGDSETVRKNIETLESYFDCWRVIDGFSSPSDFLHSCMSPAREPGKIIVDNYKHKDIFSECLHTYGEISGTQRQFPLNRTVLLYAVVCYLRNRSAVSAPDFARRLRSVNNLIQNSADEVSDRAERSRMPAVLRQTEAVMLTGAFDDTIENSFNAGQIAEEKEKSAFLDKNPERADLVYSLEDHHILKGQISIIGVDHIDLAARFISLFACDWDLVDCALMSIGDYGQRERNKWRYQYGSKNIKTAWDELFHRSANTGFEMTGSILVTLLAKAEIFTDKILRSIADGFIGSCESAGVYPWRYYYVKYSSFRPGSYGKFASADTTDSKYMFSVMQTRFNLSSSTYMPCLKEADPAHLADGYMGQRLVYGDVHIICTKDSFLLRGNAGNEVIETVKIPQNENGEDIRDRIILLKQFIRKLGY